MSVWALARSQHGLVTREQLVDLGYSPDAIRHRLERGRLHPVRRRVYAVGNRRLDRWGQLLAAVLSCGHGAMVSHWTALFAWGVDDRRPLKINVTITDDVRLRQPGVIVHRRPLFPDAERTEHHAIPITTALRALFDVAPGLENSRLERLLNESDRLDLVSSDELRLAIAGRVGQPGVAAIRNLVDRASYLRTDSELERRFLGIARRTSLPAPETQVQVGGFRVDFMWPGLELVVETDGLRYHRTELQQREDRKRDRALAARGLTVLRFTHYEVVHQPERVRDELEQVARTRQDRSVA